MNRVEYELEEFATFIMKELNDFLNEHVILPSQLLETFEDFVYYKVIRRFKELYVETVEEIYFIGRKLSLKAYFEHEREILLNNLAYTGVWRK